MYKLAQDVDQVRRSSGLGPNPDPDPYPNPNPNPNPAQVQRDLLEVKHTVAAIAAHLKVDTKPVSG